MEDFNSHIKKGGSEENLVIDRKRSKKYRNCKIINIWFKDRKNKQ